MQVIYNDWAKSHTNLETVGLGLTHTSLDLTIFIRSPLFEEAYEVTEGVGFDSDHMAYVTDSAVKISDILAMEGWQEATNTGDTTISLTATTTASGVKSINYGGNDWSYEGDPIFATAFAISTPTGGNVLAIFRPENPVLLWGESGSDVTSTIGEPNGTILSYLENAGINDSSSPALGNISVSVPVASWESARAAHVWMDPQRINLVVNSSFETTSNFGWRANTAAITGAMTNIDGGLGRGGRVKCLEVSGTGTKIVESLPFPTRFDNRWWSVEAALAGQGTVRLGILFWEEDGDPNGLFLRRSEPFQITAADPTGSPSRDDFRQIGVLIPNLEEKGIEAQLRIEFVPDSATNKLWVDDCLVEPNEAQLGYFDGDWTAGQKGDYRWYGKAEDQTALSHKSFSIFYNNRNNLRRQLFGYFKADGSYHKGTADEFVPEGVSVIPHWDDIYSAKTQSWFEDVYIPIQDHSDSTVVATPAETNDPV